jgi:hypothetical protein
MKTQVVKTAIVVPGEGFEPSVEDPKSSALPLGHPGADINSSVRHSDRRVTPHRPQTFEYLMRAWLIAAVLVAASGCGAYQFPGAGSSPSPATGSVSGRVLAVPCAPVEQLGSPCAGRPVPKLELDYVAGGSVVASALTDSGGYYSITLEPGSYQVKLKTYMRVISGPLTLAISSRSSVVANYVVDSGIRLPAPQQ